MCDMSIETNNGYIRTVLLSRGANWELDFCNEIRHLMLKKNISVGMKVNQNLNPIVPAKRMSTSHDRLWIQHFFYTSMSYLFRSGYNVPGHE